MNTDCEDYYYPRALDSVEAKNRKLESQLRAVTEDLKKSCHCRPGGGPCACCLILKKLEGEKA